MESTDRRAHSEGVGEDALREILVIERQAAGIENDARSEADRILQAAKDQAASLKETAVARARAESEAMLHEGLTAIEGQAVGIREEAELQAQAWVRVAETRVRRAVDWVLSVVSLGEAD